MLSARCFEGRVPHALLSCIAVSAMVLGGCQDIKRQAGLKEILRDVKTSADERQAFIEIHARSNPPRIQLAFKPINHDGQQVDMAVEGWWHTVAVLKLSLGDETVYHYVLDGKNIDLLMGE